jgi:hypothetical protein
VVPVAKGDPPVGAAYQSTVFPLATEAVSSTVPCRVLEVFVPVGAAGTPAIPLTEIPLVVAPDEDTKVIPDSVPVPPAARRIETVVVATAPPERGSVSVEEYVVPFNEYSKPETAAIAISAVKFAPETVNVWGVEAVPSQEPKEVKALVTVIAGVKIET